MGTKKSTMVMATAWQRCAYNRIGLSFTARWLYALKAILCIFLGLHKNIDLHHEMIHGVARFNKQKARWHPDPNVHLFTELAVGSGMGNWFYHTFTDATPDGEIGEENNGRVQNIRL